MALTDLPSVKEQMCKTLAESASEFEAESEPEQESIERRPSLEARFEEFHTEVYQQLQVLERGHRDLAASLCRIESNTAEILAFVRSSSSSVGATSGATTCTTSSLPPDP